MRRWGFLTNHAMVFLHVVQHPHATVREIALASGITERATLSILRDLRLAEIVERERQGRRNVYSVNFEATARYRRQGPATDLLPGLFVEELVKELLRLSARGASRGRPAPGRPAGRALPAR